MTIRRRSVAVAVTFAALAFSGAAVAASPTKDATFTGTATGTVRFETTFVASDPVSFKTSANGKKLTFSYGDTACELAGGVTGGVPIALGSLSVKSGKFSTSAHKSTSSDSGSTLITKTTLSGKFTSATKASGTLTYTQTESGSPGSCGPIKLKFTASTP